MKVMEGVIWQISHTCHGDYFLHLWYLDVVGCYHQQSSLHFCFPTYC